MKLEQEHMLLFAGSNHPHVYITGDDDETSPDVRLSFVTSHTTVWHDMTPDQLCQLRSLINDVLDELNYCQHGKNRGEWGDGCMECNDALRKETEAPNA